MVYSKYLNIMYVYKTSYFLRITKPFKIHENSNQTKTSNHTVHIKYWTAIKQYMLITLTGLAFLAGGPCLDSKMN